MRSPPFLIQKNMQIFDKQLFSTDAEKFLSWSCAVKKEWIKKNTNQQNDELIDEFIKTVRADGDECQGCKDAKVTATTSRKKKKQQPEPDEEA